MHFIMAWWRPVLEITVFAIFLYYSFLALKGTRTYQVLKGIVILLIIYVIAKYLELTTITLLLGQIFGVAVIAVVVIFQPEIRRAFASIGRTHFSSHHDSDSSFSENLSQTIAVLSEKYIGALIVISRSISLQPYIDTGVRIDSAINMELLVTIFTHRTPLHDGAVIIDGNTIVAAACLLPLSQRSSFSKSLGTRHRAAIGLSEETDAIVLVVSEETGHISIVSGGKITMNVNLNTLKGFLSDLFQVKEKKSDHIATKFIKKIFNIGKEKNA
ncbi:MAG: hypothetical protein ACD_79C00635G0003 [uncultured bacterium]|nr:MAG: hypothetical protein ACD_79C00635G0003 [uncultured bacterium]